MVHIEKLVYGGAGLSRDQGKVTLVPFVLPGEDVEVAAVSERRDLVEARVTKVLTTSRHRVTPLCPYFARCGGCHYQHTSYEFQLEQKREILREVLRRVGKVEPPEEIGVICGEPWGYRNRIQLHFEPGRIGFREAASDKLCEAEQCPIASVKLNEAMASLGRMARDRRFPGFVKSVELFTNETAVQLNVQATEGNRRVARSFFDWAAAEIPGLVSGCLEYAAVGETFRVGYRSFFQVNRFLIGALVSAALGDERGRSAFDLYAGVGLFTVPLARRFSQVTALEAGAGAFDDLEWNAQRAGVRVSAVRHTVDLFLEGVVEAPEFALADPPRAGLGKSVVRQLARIGPPRLTIVACDPATLARDLAALLAGGYHLRGMTLVDLFPQTFHMETIARLERGS